MEDELQEKLKNWYDLSAQLKLVKEKEMTLRLALEELAFPDHVEGTSSLEFKPGWILKNSLKYNRIVDETDLEAVLCELKNVNPDDVIKWKPELKLAAYRKMTEQDKAIFDQALIIRKGTPSFTIVEKKK